MSKEVVAKHVRPLRFWVISREIFKISSSSYSNFPHILPHFDFYHRILRALGITNSLSDLKRVHALIITHGLCSKSVLASRLISAYASFSGLLVAQKLFENLPKQTVYTCNYMLKAFVDRGRYELTLKLYSRMLSVFELSPDPITYCLVVKACCVLKAIREGKLAHVHILVTGFESDLYLATALVDLYAKCGCINDARKVFDKMPQRDIFVWTAIIYGHLLVGDHHEALCMFSNMKEAGLTATTVTWNALIGGLVRGGLISDALHQFNRMQVDRVHPDKVSLCIILPALSRFAILNSGSEAHGYIVRMGFGSDLFVVSALVDMYGKCGKLALARCLFDRVEVKDTGLWNSMIVAYGIHGNCKEALQLFYQMRTSETRPNEITFTSLLSACSHAGMVNEGRQCFDSMVCDYGLMPCHEHYVCMVDMYGRAGQLEEAYNFIQSMPTEPTKDVWGAFLSACKNHQDVQLAEIAAQHIFGCKEVSRDAGYHVMMSNIYAETGQWGNVAKLRTCIRDVGLKKRTGYSWIEIGDIVHTFYVADVSHPQSDQIYGLLRSFELVDFHV